MSTDNAVSLNGTATTWPEVLTLAEAAAFLKVSENALELQAVARKVPGQYIDQQWRFSKQALLDWLRSPGKPGTQNHLRALVGCWKDDPTVDAMIEEIYRERKRHLVGD